MAESFFGYSFSDFRAPREMRVLENVAELRRRLRHGSLSREEHVGHFADDERQHGRRHRDPRRPVQRVAESFGKLLPS